MVVWAGKNMMREADSIGSSIHMRRGMGGSGGRQGRQYRKRDAVVD
jgi:hypothetical protein